MQLSDKHDSSDPNSDWYEWYQDSWRESHERDVPDGWFADSFCFLHTGSTTVASGYLGFRHECLVDRTIAGKKIVWPTIQIDPVVHAQVVKAIHGLPKNLQEHLDPIGWYWIHHTS